jgi:hypothetical protein
MCRAAAIHNAAANSAIYAASAHAHNANAYGEQYNELMDKYHELEKVCCVWCVVCGGSASLSPCAWVRIR